MSTSFCIEKTWDNRPIDHKPACIQLKRVDDGLLLTIEAPYFNKPARPDRGVDEVFNLWDYEGKFYKKFNNLKLKFSKFINLLVVEAFFLNEANQYIELEFGP
jgi:hypothetical protein